MTSQEVLDAATSALSEESEVHAWLSSALSQGVDPRYTVRAECQRRRSIYVKMKRMSCTPEVFSQRISDLNILEQLVASQ